MTHVLHHGVVAPARLLVLVSGEGSNMKALVQACQDINYGAQVVAVGADRPCAGIEWARERGIDTFVHHFVARSDRAQWDREMTELIGEFAPDLVVCAGFLKLLGPAVLGAFAGRILNTHNSLLPAYPGTRAPADAIAGGAKVSGATLFFVDAGTDTGAIIAQVPVPVQDEDDAEALLDRIKEAERAQLVEAIGQMVRGGWSIEGRRVRLGRAT